MKRLILLITTLIIVLPVFAYVSKFDKLVEYDPPVIDKYGNVISIQKFYGGLDRSILRSSTINIKKYGWPITEENFEEVAKSLLACIPHIKPKKCFHNMS